MMQEHPHLIKRASAGDKEIQLGSASTYKILNHLDIVAPPFK
jgi:hypothetical protein